MITLNQTAGYDNEAIFVFKFTFDTTVAYLSTKDITLDSTNYDGAAILHNSISAITETNNLIRGGGICEVGSLSLSIINKSDNASFSDFFDSFYPNNSVYQANREVDIGIVWDGATTESQITWLQTMLISEYSYDTSLHFSLVSYTEADNPSLPYYTVQEDYDNGVSYFPKAPDESMGVPIPIVYGDFNIETIRGDTSYNIPQAEPCSPIVIIDDDTGTDLNYKFIVASHSIKGYNYRPTVCYSQSGSISADNSTVPDIVQYNDMFDTMTFIYNTTVAAGGSSSYSLDDNWHGSFYSILQPNKDTQYIYADMYKRFDAKLPGFDYNFKHLFRDTGTTTDITLSAGNKMAFGFTDDSQSQSLSGKFDTDSSAYIIAKISNSSGADVDLEFTSTQPSSSLSKASTFTIANGVTTLVYFDAWAITSETYSDFTNRIFAIENKDAANSVAIEQVFMVYSKILIDGFGFHYILASNMSTPPPKIQIRIGGMYG